MSRDRFCVSENEAPIEGRTKSSLQTEVVLGRVRLSGRKTLDELGNKRSSR